MEQLHFNKKGSDGMKICYFTATGNCLYVARKIGGELLSIPQLIRQEKIEITDDAVGVVCPVYAGEMPMMVREFLSKVKIRTDYFFFIYTYGSGYGEAYAHVELAAKEAGLKLRYINAVIMVDNFLPIFDMQDQMDTLPQKDVEGQLEKICQDIAERKERPVTITPESEAQMAYFKERLAIPILRNDTALGYIVNDNCNRCGVCAKVCPANNITVTDKVTFSDCCEVCYACLHSCPQSAIHMKVEKNTVHFRNEHISLQDIITANE